MTFWDTSAIVPVLVPEAQSAECTGILTARGEPVVWALAPVEALSALQRKRRDGSLSDERWRDASLRLEQLREYWSEVGDLELVRERAERLLALHPLRAADALQLAAALVACEERPRDHRFICIDTRLAAAAAKEGFRVMP